MTHNLIRRVAAETIGTAFLVTCVVGSGIMGERLAAGSVALALLVNAIATGGVLFAFIVTFGPISGANFNPAVTLALATQGDLPWRDVAPYMLGQTVGAMAGVLTAHGMFGFPFLFASRHTRSGAPQLLGEFVATFGLLCVIWACIRFRSTLSAFAVSAYIVAAYWFTVSTSFANPAVTLARAFSDTFSGIRPVDAPYFIVAQFMGALAATALFRWLITSPLQPIKDENHGH